MCCEIDILRELEHPNIIKTHAVYEDMQNIYVVMDYHNGGELFHSIKKATKLKRRLPEVTIKKITTNILSALQYLSMRGIVHRDLKPENIILKERGKHSEVVIADFGLSVEMPKSGNKLTFPCGSLGYVAPEVLMGDGYNTTADIFSIGSILYMMLTGKNGIRASKSKNLKKMNKLAQFNFDGSVWSRPEMDVAKDLVMSLVERDPDQRIVASVALMHPWLNGQPLGIDVIKSSDGEDDMIMNSM